MIIEVLVNELFMNNFNLFICNNQQLLKQLCARGLVLALQFATLKQIIASKTNQSKNKQTKDFPCYFLYFFCKGYQGYTVMVESLKNSNLLTKKGIGVLSPTHPLQPLSTMGQGFCHFWKLFTIIVFPIKKFERRDESKLYPYFIFC